MEFDGHIVTIESFESTESSNLLQQQQLPLQQQAARIMPQQAMPQQVPQIRPRYNPPTIMTPKKRAQPEDAVDVDLSFLNVSASSTNQASFTTQAYFTHQASSNHQALSNHQAPSTHQAPSIKNQASAATNQTSYSTTPQKRVRVGLSKRINKPLHQSTHSEATLMQVDQPPAPALVHMEPAVTPTHVPRNTNTQGTTVMIRSEG